MKVACIFNIGQFANNKAWLIENYVIKWQIILLNTAWYTRDHNKIDVLLYVFTQYFNMNYRIGLNFP